MDSILIKGAHGGRIDVSEGQLLEVVNVEGNQVCDFFAFNRENIREAVSPSHMRSVMRRIVLHVGDMLWTNLRRPMFEVIEDTAQANDFSVPACDPVRYRMAFGIDRHRSCRVNLAEATADLNIPYEYLPDPVNFFQPTRIEGGLILDSMSPAKPGDKVILRARMNVIAVGSACPQDQNELNNYSPSDIRFIVREN